MQFTKMHGLGNDFIMLNCLAQPIQGDLPALAQQLCDRHFGIGADGLILILPSEVYDFRMRIYNADGSLAAMCGNGVRCVGKFLYDNGLTDQTEIALETDAGLRTIGLHVENGQVHTVSVGMGKPELDCARIPANAPCSPCINQPIQVEEKTFDMTLVSMGNPHAVIYMEDLGALDMEADGPLIQRSPVFPDSVNVEFVQVLSPDTVRMRVYERGVGETLACGTGACAVAVASARNGFTGTRVTVQLPKGELYIDCTGEEVIMTGPAETVFTGETIGR